MTLESFFTEAPEINPKASQITGVICGHRVEEIRPPYAENPLSR